MNLRRLTILAVFVMLLSSCSSNQPKQPPVTPRFEDSFTVIQLAPNIFKVAFKGDVRRFLQLEPKYERGIGGLLTALGSKKRRETRAEKRNRELIAAKGMQTVIDLTLLRSAEITYQNGFRYFVVANAQTWEGTSTTTSPTEAETKTARGLLGEYETKTTVTHGETRTSINPIASNTIVCYREKPEGIEVVYDAEFVSSSIRKNYNVPE